MKITRSKLASVAIVLLLTGMLLLGGCANMTPVTPQAPATLPAQHSPAVKDITVTYNYHDTDKVQLSANNIVLKTGQKLILKPAPGLTKNTRFRSSGEYFFGDVMTQETGQESGRVVFAAKNPGKGKLQIIPNSNEFDRAIDLWVTVQ